MVAVSTSAGQQALVDRNHAARLVQLWRRSPLTVLLRDAQTGAGDFVAHEVMPLVARRSIDRAGHAASRAEAARPTSVRARSVPGAPRHRELVLRFDAGGAAEPALALRQAWWSLWPGDGAPAAPPDAPAPASLWGTASALHAVSGAPVLLLIEGLRDWLLPRNDAPQARQALLDELAAVLADTDLQVHVLWSLDEWTEPLLGSLWRRIPGLSRQLLLMDMTLPTPGSSLPGWIGQPPPSATAPRPTPPASPPRPAPSPARSSASPPPPSPLPLRPAPPPVPAAPSRPTPAAATGPPRAPAKRDRTQGARTVNIASAVLAAGLAMVAVMRPWSSPAPRTNTRAQGTVVTPARAPAGDAAQDLARVMSAAGLELASAQGDDDVALALSRTAGGSLALLRYNALTTAATAPPGGNALQLLAPLYVEALHFVVRADSSLRAVHEIADARAVQVGPPRGARAGTGAAAWSAMFGAPWRAAQADAGRQQDALRSLLAGDVDVVLLVGSALEREWQALAPIERDALRLLPLDLAQPATRRARQRFLIADQAVDPLRRDGAQQPALAVMTFLAAADNRPADDTIARAAMALCAALPALRSTAASEWRNVQPARSLPAPWPYADDAVEVFEHCEAPDVPRGKEEPVSSNPSERKRS
jgi:hypothetical protein